MLEFVSQFLICLFLSFGDLCSSVSVAFVHQLFVVLLFGCAFVVGFVCFVFLFASQVVCVLLFCFVFFVYSVFVCFPPAVCFV